MKHPIAPIITDKVLKGLQVMQHNGLIVEHLEGMLDEDAVKDFPEYEHLSSVKAARKYIDQRTKYHEAKAEWEAAKDTQGADNA